MANRKEVTGYIFKEESVSSLSHSILPGSYVVEIDHPFPGYYGQDVVDLTKPRSTLLITKEKYTWESILRATEKFNKFLNFTLKSSASEIHDGSKMLPAIRIKGMKQFEDIRTVQNAFMEEGFNFMKSRRKVKNHTVLIKLKKFFELGDLGEGIFKDEFQPKMAYCVIPQKPNWELFRKITTDIKYNISDQNYDVCLASFYLNDKIVDAIRVYKPKLNTDLLKEIRTLYCKFLDDY